MIYTRSRYIDDMDVMVFFVELFAWDLSLRMLAGYKYTNWRSGLSGFCILAPLRFDSRKLTLMAAWMEW